MSSFPSLVLVVDDEPAICDLTKIFLEMSGHIKVDTFVSVKEARASISEKTYDAIVSDYQMPNEDGIRFLKSLRESGDRTPFILFTGKGREDVVIEALNNGADSYLQKGGEAKPQYAELEHRLISLISRHRAETGLRLSESNMQRAEEVAGFGNWQIDMIDKTIFGSHGAIKLCGLSKNVFTFEEWRSYTLPEYHPLLNASLYALVNEGKEYNIEFKLRRPIDGRVIDVQSQAEYDPHKHVIFGTLLDITERRIAVESLKRKNRELLNLNAMLKGEKDFSDALIESLPGIFYIYDFDTGQLVGWNRNHQDVSGYSKDEMQCMHALDWFAPERKDKVLSAIDECSKTGKNSFESKLLMKDGREVPYLFTIKRFESGGRSYFMGVGLDITQNKKVEEDLRNNQARFDELADHASVVTWDVDADGLYTYVSSVSEKVWGFAPDELVGKKHFYDLAPEEERAALKDGAMGIFSQKGPLIGFENRIVRKDGRIITVSTNGIPIVGKDGVLTGYQGTDTDITERKRSRMEVDRAMAAMESSKDGIAILDADGRYVFLNQAHADIYGYDSPADLMGRTWEILYDDRVRQEFLESYMPILRERGLWRGESVGLRRDGSTFPQDVSLTMLEDGGLICIVRDTSAMMKDREALQQKTAMLEAQTTASMDGILVIDQDQRRVRANERIKDLFNVPRDIIEDEDDTRLMKHMAASMRDPGGFMEKVLYYYRHKDVVGHEEITLKNGKVLDRFTAPILGKDGEYYGRTWTFRDITDEKLTMEALHEANSKLNLLSSITRHDINNQLMMLSSNLMLLELRGLDEAGGQYLRKAKAAAERVSNMVQFTREYQDIGVRAPVWHDVRRLIETAISDVRLEQVNVVNDVPEGLEIFADPLISKVFHNLIQNAVQHGWDLTSVRFTVEDVDNVVMVVCEDDGNGIPPELKDRLFTKGVGKEHGFGLFLCREILAITGINITEESALGKGARFVLTLPSNGHRDRGA